MLKPVQVKLHTPPHGIREKTTQTLGGDRPALLGSLVALCAALISTVESLWSSSGWKLLPLAMGVLGVPRGLGFHRLQWTQGKGQVRSRAV